MKPINACIICLSCFLKSRSYEFTVDLMMNTFIFKKFVTHHNSVILCYFHFTERTETIRVLAHERLRDLLNILRSILDKYSALRSTDVHTAAVLLITHIKGKFHTVGSQKDFTGADYC